MRSRGRRPLRLGKFDNQWRRLAGWVFPPEVLDRFAPHRRLGGAWGNDGRLYCTGHDRGEAYVLELPRGGSTLVLRETIELGVSGQGVALDHSAPGVVYGIRRQAGEVAVCRLPEQARDEHPVASSNRTRALE